MDVPANATQDSSCEGAWSSLMHQRTAYTAHTAADETHRHWRCCHRATPSLKTSTLPLVKPRSLSHRGLSHGKAERFMSWRHSISWQEVRARCDAPCMSSGLATIDYIATKLRHAALRPSIVINCMLQRRIYMYLSRSWQSTCLLHADRQTVCFQPLQAFSTINTS